MRRSDPPPGERGEVGGTGVALTLSEDPIRGGGFAGDAAGDGEGNGRRPGRRGSGVMMLSGGGARPRLFYTGVGDGAHRREPLPCAAACGVASTERVSPPPHVCIFDCRHQGEDRFVRCVMHVAKSFVAVRALFSFQKFCKIC